MRANKLDDLVYKSGQAGIQRATVSIVFANDDPQCVPAGYPMDRHKEITVTRTVHLFPFFRGCVTSLTLLQIVIGGRNKYTINGYNATAQRVADMFRSVQLNVNNPHFLIMQGQITKVLKMKPLEVSSSAIALRLSGGEETLLVLRNYERICQHSIIPQN